MALWVRAVGDLNLRMLPGTELARVPFWSPDSRFIGFIAGGKLKKIDPSGSFLQTLSDVEIGGGGGGAGPAGGTWNHDGIIVFAPTNNGGLYMVPDTGGAPVRLTELDRGRGEVGHSFPMFLPDGRHFLYAVASTKAGESGIYVGSLDSRERRRVVDSVPKAVFAPPDYLVFGRAGILMAQRLDLKRLELTGEPFRMAEPVSSAAIAFTASNNGVVAYRGGDIQGVVAGRLEWFDRQGRRSGEVATSATYWSPALSPDGRQLAVHRAEGGRDIWIFDLVRATSSKFTFDPRDDDDPTWSPDGRRVVFSSSREGQYDLFVKNSAGGEQEELLLKSDYRKRPEDFSRDGQFLLYEENNPQTGWDVWVLPMTGDRKPQPVIQGPLDQWMSKFSPDGRWIAYASNESGRYEVYVQSFPPAGRKYQISTSGGVQPLWRGDGKELFYLSLGGDVTTVPIAPKATGLEFGVQQKLFTAVPTIVVGARGAWSATPDGQRFLIVSAAGGSNVSPITVIMNWQSGLAAHDAR
jgi:Tol biopolymer transport system component